MNTNIIGKAVGALLIAIVVTVAIGFIGDALLPSSDDGEDRVATAAQGEGTAAETEAEEPAAEPAEEAAEEPEAEDATAEASEEAVEAAEEAAEVEVEEAAPGIDLSAADVAAGEKVFKKCFTCHTVNAGGPNRVGPNLFDIVGREIGRHEGYRYSSAMAGLGGTWTVAALDAYLTKPKDFVPGTKMKFSGLKKEQDRINVIAYLATLTE